MKLPESLFHYTVGVKLPGIATSRRLEPRGYGLAISKRERPVLWFSENPEWDPTATKVVSRDNGRTFVRPALSEMQVMVGIYRFRLDTRNPEALNAAGVKLVPWSRIQMVAHIDPKEAAVMVRSGLQLGATPTHWWGVMEPVPISLCVSGVLRLETRRPFGAGGRDEWMPIEMSEALADYESRGLRVRQAKASETPGAMGI
jgi:hypothetical protein